MDQSFRVTSTVSPHWGNEVAVDTLREEIGNGDTGIHVNDAAEAPVVTIGGVVG